MNSSTYKKSQLKYVSSLVYSQPEELEYIIANIDDFYAEWFEKKRDKSTGIVKTYKDGTPKSRPIRPAVSKLRGIQDAIKNNILAKYTLPDNIQGGVQKRTNASNANMHKGKKYKFTTDLHEFYPSVSHEMVYSAFLSLGFSDLAASWLTKLTTWKYQLPQGASTSTHLANIVFYFRVDQKLIEIASEYNLTYTRFIDDITFSSQHDFKPILNQILFLIQSGDFKISYRKTLYSGEQVITGVSVFNDYIDVPDRIKAKAREEMFSDSNQKPYTNYMKLVRTKNSSLLRKRK